MLIITKGFKMNICTILKNSKQVLFTDSEYFNKDITGVKSLADIKDIFQIKGNLVKADFYSNKIQYKLKNSDYDFTLTIL